MADNDKFKFFLEPSLQEVFRDKDTGLPLVNGYIEFWKDSARTEPKPVFKLSGTPADPVFIELPNPLPLTGIGTTSDGGGNDIKTYYFPFDEDGDQELYFIQVYSSGGIFQFSREGWPDQIDTSGTDNIFNDLENYINNGQFLVRRLYPVGAGGLLTQTLTNVALGGWIINLANGFTSQNTVVFERFSDNPVNPDSAPRYALRFAGTNPNPAENIKDLKVIYGPAGVSKFSGKTFTIQFEAVSNTGSPLNIQLLYQKNYGSGGSPEVETLVTTFTIEPISYAKYKTTLTISDDTATFFGANDDDEFRFVFRVPTNVTFDISMVDFMAVLGTFDNNIDYPTVSPYQALASTMGGSIDITGTDDADIGDVLKIGENTVTASAEPGTGISQLVWAPADQPGKIIEDVSINGPGPGWLYCDGATYDVAVPNPNPEYVRLLGAIGNIYGNGIDGFNTVKAGLDTLTHTASQFNAATAPNQHTTSFTVSITVPGDGTTRQIVEVITTSIAAGEYYEIFSPTGRSTVYWFSLDGAGSSPELLFPGSLVKEIPITAGTNNADAVADAIVANFSTQLVVDDRRGIFVRGLDDGAGVDPDASNRTYLETGEVIGDVIGSHESDAIQDHQHLPVTGNFKYSGGAGAADGGNFTAQSINHTGVVDQTGLGGGPAALVSTETRPINTATKWWIKT